jgi:hypothetical protein
MIDKTSRPKQEDRLESLISHLVVRIDSALLAKGESE